eukprot:2332529-Pyramimonas_sp.AAC.1
MGRATHSSSQTSAGRMATLPSCSREKANTLCRMESSGGRSPKRWQRRPQSTRMASPEMRPRVRTRP